MNIAGREIGKPVFIVAELSGNHGGSYNEALRMIHTAKECGADAVKLQTLRPEDMPDKDEASWDGRKWIDVYREVAMPWKWHVRLKQSAESIGITLFTSVYSNEAISWLEEHGGMPAYKIPSWLCADEELLKAASLTEKPIIVSVRNHIEAGRAIHQIINLALLVVDDVDEIEEVCVTNTRVVFEVPIGYSNHGNIADCVEAVRQGACVIEQHFTLSRDSIDGKFAATPDEFRVMVESIREVEKTL